MALTTGWNSPDRPLCLLLPKMSKRTVLSAFLRLTRSSAWARVSDSRTDCFQSFTGDPNHSVMKSAHVEVLWPTKLFIIVSLCCESVI